MASLDPEDFVLEDSLRSFLAEDIGHGDITTNALIDPAKKAVGHVICNEPAVIAGLDEARILLRLVGCQANSQVADGKRVKSGSRLLHITGPASSLLKIERTLLNLLSHMSGVATATAELVEIAKKNSRGRVRIACTRKTLPGLRYFEKKAVQLGGGDTHRVRLDDAVLIKDNHLALGPSLARSVETARSKVSFTKKIEVEVTVPTQAVEAAVAGADIILLDNMKPDTVRKTVALLKEKGLRDHVILEASGRIRKENLSSYVKTGVDVISVGAITHSARSIDMSMDITPATAKGK